MFVQVLCISAQNQLKLRVLYSCVYVLHICADVGVIDWNTVYVDKYRWKGRIKQWSWCKCTVIYHAVYEQSTTHRFLYKPSNHQLLHNHGCLLQGLKILHNYKVSSSCSRLRKVHCFFFSFFFFSLHIYKYILLEMALWLCRLRPPISLRSYALHYSLILWIVILIMSNGVKDTSASSCMTYFMKA